MNFKVVAGFIKDKENFLITEREGGWEFPGGKVKKEEKNKDALKREIKEELGVEIEVEKFLFKCKEKIKGKEFIFYFYLAKIKGGEISLKEHKNYKWISFEEINKFKFFKADEKFLSSMASSK